jgi:tetratricopeptide (TPR) repeat protein
MQDREAEARQEIESAWECRQEGEPYVSERILFLRYLLGLLRNAHDDGALAGIKTILQGSGQARMAWTIQPVLDHVSLAQEDLEFLVVLADALSGRTVLAELSAFARWNDAASGGERTSGRQQPSTLQRAGDALSERREFARAERLLLRALTLYEQMENRKGIWECLNSLGVACLGFGGRRASDAEGYFKRQRIVAQSIGNRLGEGQALHNQGIAFRQQRRWDDAISVSLEACGIWWEIEDEMREGQTLDQLAKVYDDKGERRKAERARMKASEIARRLGERSGDNLINV